MPGNLKKRQLQKDKGLMPPASVRIIAGKWRSRRLNTPATAELRPTTDRLRETLFSWLSPHLEEAKCLDLFSGTGGLGFEALSRGAQTADFVEKNFSVYQSLIDNADLLDCTNAHICNMDALDFLQKKRQANYDIIFLDPPFNKKLISKCCEHIHTNMLIAPGGLIYIETEPEPGDISLPENWQLWKDKKISQVRARVYRVI